MEQISNAFGYIFSQIKSIGIFDVVDIIIVSVVIYYCQRFIRDRRAGRLAFGIITIFVIMMVSYLLNMNVVYFIITNIFQVGLIGLLIVFQSELRTFLEKIGGISLDTLGKKNDSKYTQDIISCIDAVVEGTRELSSEKTGALIVFEKGTKLGDVIKTGVIVDAAPNSFVLRNLFYNKAPLHDGAMIIRGNRFYSAGCFLPLSQNPDIIKDLGTRHRAAIGMSENSDAVIVVVSEETGIISVAHEGKLKRNFNAVSLRSELMTLLEVNNQSDSEQKPNVLDKIKNSSKIFSKQ